MVILLFLIWIKSTTAITAILSQDSGYQVFVPVTMVYSVIDPEDCSEFSGNMTVINETKEETNHFIRQSLTEHLGESKSQKLNSICQLHGVNILKRNILKVLDGRYCYFDKGYCYNNNNTLTFWDSTSKVQPLVLFEGELSPYSRKVSSFLSFTILSHERVNLTLLSFEGNFFYDFDTTKSYSTSIEGVYIKYIKLTSSTEYINKNYIKRYIGQVEDLEFPDSNVRYMVSDHSYFERLEVVSPTKKVYIESDSRACQKSTQKNIDENYLEANSLLSNFSNRMNQSVCLINSEFSINKNIIFLPDQLCEFDKGYCYMDGKKLAIWDNSPNFDPLVIFEGNFSVWEEDYLDRSFTLLTIHSEEYKFFVYTVIPDDDSGHALLTEEDVTDHNPFTWYSRSKEVYIQISNKTDIADSTTERLKTIENTATKIKISGALVIFTLLTIFLK